MSGVAEHHWYELQLPLETYRVELDGHVLAFADGHAPTLDGCPAPADSTLSLSVDWAAGTATMHLMYHGPADPPWDLLTRVQGSDG